MLKLAGETDIGKEKIETILFAPGLLGTGDKEGATKTITATSKPGTADYSHSLTLPKPSDARLVIKRVGARLQVTRDSGTSGNLYCTVSVDTSDGSANILFNAVDVQAANLQVVDLTAGTVFDLLSDGAAHTFYFFFWVDAGDSVISLVQLWEGVGSYGTVANNICLRLAHAGLVTFADYVDKLGSGTATQRAYLGDDKLSGHYAFIGEGIQVYGKDVTVLLGGAMNLCINSTVATDLNYLARCIIILRSEQ